MWCWLGGAHSTRSGYSVISGHCQRLEHSPDDNNKSSSSSSPTTVVDCDPSINAHYSVPASSSSSSSTSTRIDFCDNSTNTDDVVYHIYGYKRNWRRLLFYHLISLFPLCGLPYVFGIWWPILKVAQYQKCDLCESDILLLRNNIDLVAFIPITFITTDPYAGNDGVPQTRMFIFQQIRYLWNGQGFVQLRLPHEKGSTINEILANNPQGISPEDRGLSLQYYGLNDIQIDVKSYWQLFVDEIINPFYLFQIFSIILWSLDDYYYYAFCVLFLSSVSIATSLYQTRKQSITLRNLVEETRSMTVTVQMCSSNADDVIHSELDPRELTPGDLILIRSDMTLPCDCLLLEGGCIVNECMLSGESVPVNKYAVDIAEGQQIFEEARYKRNILFGGTEVIQVKNANSEFVRAKVLSVGFGSNKGKLIKSILFPKPIGFKFYKESMRFVLTLFFVAALGMLYSLRLYLRRNQDFRTMMFGTLDVITIIVPPALPMAMTAGTIYSQNRLKKKGVFCVSPPQINVCGKMKLVCFDKTGTLTEDGLTFYGIVNRGGNAHYFTDYLIQTVNKLNIFDKFIQGMATCHSLMRHNEDIIGDPLDQKMFESTEWLLCEQNQYSLAPRSVMPKSEFEKRHENDLPYMIGIFREFEFTSERQYMSVVVQILGHKNFILFAKGSPERVCQMVAPKSLPKNFYSSLHKYASRGYRVLALAYRELSEKIVYANLAKKKREELECNLRLLGLIVFQNRLKPETVPIIEALKDAELRIVMATGDNILTAVSVARKSAIVNAEEKVFQLDYRPGSNFVSAKEVVANDIRRGSSVIDVSLDFNHHFAVDGPTWADIRRSRPELIPKILTKGTVFARFKPEQKCELVMGLQEMDYIVAMCGDGANDCTALKAANIGVSLSQAEASVAAPFTYNQQNITCIKYLALEGRCALVTSVVIFKYMILYSVIQFCTILILYTFCTSLGNFQFLYIDLLITTAMSFTMGLQEPPANLVPRRPKSSLISPINVLPLIIHIGVCVALQVCTILCLTNQRWYSESDLDTRCYHNETTVYHVQLYGGLAAEQTIVCWENTAVFLISCFQYLIMGIVYAKGQPFRKPFYTNVAFMATFIVLLTFTLVMLLKPPTVLANFFEIESIYGLTDAELIFRYYLLVFPLIHIFTALFIEFGMAERTWLKRFIHFLTRKREPRNKFKIMQSSFSVNRPWIRFEIPPVT